MSADRSTEPTMDEENIFSGLKKKKKAKKVDDEPSPAPTPAAADDDEPAADDADNMFGDLKKKCVPAALSGASGRACQGGKRRLAVSGGVAWVTTATVVAARANGRSSSCSGR